MLLKFLSVLTHLPQHTKYSQLSKSRSHTFIKEEQSNTIATAAVRQHAGVSSQELQFNLGNEQLPVFHRKCYLLRPVNK